MNIELDEVVVQDVSDEALELAAGGAQGGATTGGATYDYYGKYRCAGMDLVKKVDKFSL